jgi:Domain of unknown function (DUF4410)
LKTIKTATLLWTLIAGLSAAPLLYAQADPVAKSPSSAIEVEMIQPGEINLPAEFQVALYENLVQQLQKEGGFSQVYRDGDRNATDVSDLVILHTSVTGFKKGSELERNVTTVGGATSITVHCKFTDKEGKVLLERDIDGKVRFFGDNLKATNDFAKKAAKVASEHFPSDHNRSAAVVVY